MRKHASILLLLVAVISFAGANTLGEPPRNANTSITLKEQLEVGLKARRPGEFEYIAIIDQMVEEGKLPVKLVKSTFQWARRKRPYQFPYFERALRVRGKRLGFIVPASGLTK